MAQRKPQSFQKIIQYVSLIFLFVYTAPSYSQQDFGEKAQEHYKLGEIYYEHGLDEEAEREFQKALQAAKQSQRNVARKQEVVSTPAPKAPQPKEYIISVGDILFVSVWENPDLTQDVFVRPDGKISFPLIDEVQAQGKTIREIDELITKNLKEYIRHPDVSVSLKKIAGEKIMVLGEVRRPGIYALTGRKTVLEAMALAGGYTKHAILGSVIVITGGFADPRAKRVNIAHALQKGKMEEDIVIGAQDIVFVPKKFIADVNYFLTQFIGPISSGATAFEDYSSFGVQR